MRVSRRDDAITMTRFYFLGPLFRRVVANRHGYHTQVYGGAAFPISIYGVGGALLSEPFPSSVPAVR